MRDSIPVRIVRVAVFVAAGVLAVAPEATTAVAQVAPVGATAEVRDVAGRLVATGEFREGRGEVLITIIFPSPAPLTGTHAIHIQETGRCDPPDFTTAGADFNPFNRKHGRQNPDGAHVGDLPNLDFTSGLTTYNTSAPGATLGTGTGSLLGANRTALVIYSGEDDQQSDPDGNSGARIACGVITAAAVPGVVTPPKPAPTPVASPPAVKPASGAATAVQPAPANPVVSPLPAQAVAPSPVTNPVAGVAPAASAIPIVAAPTAAPGPPGPIAAAPTVPPPAVATQAGGRGLGTGPALLIAILGVFLIGAGYLLRRRSQIS